MAEQPPEEPALPEPLAVTSPLDAIPAKTIPGAAAGDSSQAAQPTTSQPATSQGQDATPSTKEDPIWISKREVRKAAPRTSGSKKTTYFIEFYLVDNHGYETLAATGEDQGMCLFLSGRLSHDNQVPHLSSEVYRQSSSHQPGSGNAYDAWSAG